MTDEQKTTKEIQDPSALPQDDGSKPDDESVAQNGAVVEIDKIALDEVIEKATQEKPKKGKGQYKTIQGKDIKPGMLVRVHQKIIETNAKGEEKERVQVFQGMVLAHKHGNEAGATILVRKVSEGIGVEKIFPLAMPSIEKIELVRTYRVRQARPYFLRATKKRLTEIKE